MAYNPKKIAGGVAGGALLFGLTKLPFGYFVFLLTVALLYMLLTTVAKYFYQKKYHELI